MPSITHRSKSFDEMSAQDAAAVQAAARALQQAAHEGRTQALLRGKNLALLCERGDDADAEFFRRAATELGANVAHIRPKLSALSTPEEVQHTARVLGRLYDAIECQGIAAALVRSLGADAGVPVYDGLASARHPSAALAESLGSDAAPSHNRRFVLQAVLLGSVA